jgi:hypothetical protein
MKNAKIAAQIDNLGAIRAKIAELEKQERALVDMLKRMKPGRYEGQLFEANLFQTERASTDWKAIAEKVGYSPQLKAAHTGTTAGLVLKLQARTGLPAAA